MKEYKVKVTPEALEDLNRYLSYILFVLKNEQAFDAVLDDYYETIEQLTRVASSIQESNKSGSGGGVVDGFYCMVGNSICASNNYYCYCICNEKESYRDCNNRNHDIGNSCFGIFMDNISNVINSSLPRDAITSKMLRISSVSRCRAIIHSLNTVDCE